MIVGEIANFAAYAFAPALLVTPLGALSIIFRYGDIVFFVAFASFETIVDAHHHPSNLNLDAVFI